MQPRPYSPLLVPRSNNRDSCLSVLLCCCLGQAYDGGLASAVSGHSSIALKQKKHKMLHMPHSSANFHVKLFCDTDLYLATNHIFTPVAIDEAKQGNSVKRGYIVIWKTFVLEIFIIYIFM